MGLNHHPIDHLHWRYTIFLCSLFFIVSGCVASNSPDEPSTLGPDPILEGHWKNIPLGATWQIQLSEDINTDYPVQLYDVDLFDTPVDTIDFLKQHNIIVICYFSAGSWEDWRVDANDFPNITLGNTLDGWPDEHWLDIRHASVLTIMETRMDLAVEKGCDGVDADNMDGYTNNTGLPITAGDQLRFNRQIANAAHARNLAISLKNDLDQIEELVDYFDFSVNEQCHEYNECNALLPFIAAGKAVLNIEYDQHIIAQQNDVCTASQQLGISTVFMPLLLNDEFRITCDN